MTRETAASIVRPGHDRPERAPACLADPAGAAAAADDAHDRPRPGDTAQQPLSDQERAAIRQAGADDARRSRAEHGFPERIEDPAAVAVLAALLRDACPPPRNETGCRTTRPAA